MMLLVLYGVHQGVARVRNVTSNSFEIRFQEWDYLNRSHVFEDIGYLVVEAGTYQLTDGTRTDPVEDSVPQNPLALNEGGLASSVELESLANQVGFEFANVADSTTQGGASLDRLDFDSLDEAFENFDE